MDVYTTIESPLGELLLAGDGTALTRVSFDVTSARAGWRPEPLAFAEMERQFLEYFAGERTSFELPFATRGTAFQERVWEEVAKVPYGRTISYGALAARIGAPADRVRAVGAAVGANPLPVVVPCHRVVGADGGLTGYAGGLERKRELLTLEGVLQPRLWSTP
ncbi:methylated-DNA--[protein]-cysteine S-methyltransferase [Nonomuraea antimicrobica]|uniref:Methylated-DNA--protein-cysteine methyltransferase n=1 Tax=Nonomuraea antimicrobica TaxID=561173 RepID=A0ABP7BZG6_9ACTN